MTDPDSGTPGSANRRRALLLDPAWKPSTEDEIPPDDAVLGGWSSEVAEGDFHANPDYKPNRPNSATDPVDAALRLAIQGDVNGDVVLSTVLAATLSVALDEDGHAVVAIGADDIPAILVATAADHRERVGAADWVEISAVELADALPDEGVDVLLNPGAPSSMRLVAGVLKEAVADGDIPRPEGTSSPSGADVAPPNAVDAVLRRVVDGDSELAELRPFLLDGWFDVALTGGHPLTGQAESPCLLLTTDERHRWRVNAEEWQRVDLTELATLLADDVDVLVNPGDVASIRLSGEFIRETVLLGYGSAVD